MENESKQSKKRFAKTAQRFSDKTAKRSRNSAKRTNSTGTKQMSLEGIPGEVHDKIIAYKHKITGERNQAFTLKEAYVEFLKEHTK